jgi:hypothetical protein
MSGRGSLDSPHVPEPHPAVFMFNKDYRWHPAREPLRTARNEVDGIATDGGTGVGPRLAFGRAMLEHLPGLTIGLVPCARGASSIEDWQPSTSQNSLYGACLRRVRAASTYGRVYGVLFSQGESDADDPQLYPDRVLSAENWGAKIYDIRGRAAAGSRRSRSAHTVRAIGQLYGVYPSSCVGHRQARASGRESARRGYDRNGRPTDIG